MSFPQKTATNSSRWNKYTSTLAFIKNDAERQSFFTEECWNHRESCSNYTKNCTNTDIHQYHGDTRSFCKVFHVFFHVFLHHLPSIAKSHHGLSPGIVKKQNLVSMQKKLAPQSHVHLSPSITSDFDVLCLSEQKRSQHCGNSTENHGSFSAVLNMDLFEGRKEWHVGVGPTPSWDAAFVILSITGFVALLMCFFWLNWSRCGLFLLWGKRAARTIKRSYTVNQATSCHLSIFKIVCYYWYHLYFYYYYYWHRNYHYLDCCDYYC